MVCLVVKNKFIELKVDSIKRQREYYENKGYELPKKLDNYNRERLDLNKTIQIKTEDLPINSNVKVIRVCDICKEESEVLYFSILKGREKRESNNDLCKGCAIRERERTSDSLKLDSDNKMVKEFVRCDEKYYENYSANDFNVTSNIKCLWKCSMCDYEWYCRISDKYLRKSICPNCSDRVVNERTSLALNYKYLLEEWDYELNTVDPVTLTSGSHITVYWKCINGHSWSTPVHSRTCMKSNCPTCASSKGELKIMEYLDGKYEYVHQVTYEGLVGLGGKQLSYDFYIPSLNILIEYQGEFHDGNGGKGNDYIMSKLEIQTEHDKRKREYALNNDIKLLEIWYYDYNNINEILKEILK